MVPVLGGGRVSQEESVIAPLMWQSHLKQLNEARAVVDSQFEG